MDPRYSQGATPDAFNAFIYGKYDCVVYLGGLRMNLNVLCVCSPPTFF